MLFNHKRQLVSDWTEGQESICPECETALVAKRGQIKIWHWAHKSNEAGCGSYETDWHLVWKMTYLLYPGWEVEYPLEINGSRYRIDAYRKETGSVREFVHSLSEHYTDKHMKLVEADYDVLWIWDGAEFKSAYAGKMKHTDTTHYMGVNWLKPRAAHIYRILGGYLHYNSEFFRSWKKGKDAMGKPLFYWFVIESPILLKMARDFCATMRRYHEEKRVFRETAKLVSEGS